MERDKEGRGKGVQQRVVSDSDVCYSFRKKDGVKPKGEEFGLASLFYTSRLTYLRDLLMARNKNRHTILPY